MNTKKKGNEGEDLARIYLAQKGYKIRHCNWQYGHKELDIVAEHDGMLIVVEVKSRTSTIFENPEDAVSDRKIRMIVDATQGYMETYDISMEVRFDVITVLFHKNGAPIIEHFEDAFLAPG